MLNDFNVKGIFWGIFCFFGVYYLESIYGVFYVYLGGL